MQLDPQFPTLAAFMAAPHDDGFTLILVDQIFDDQLLADGETLRDDRKAAFRADIYSEAYCLHVFPVFMPFSGNLNAGIDTRACADMLHAAFETRFVADWHRKLPVISRYRHLGPEGRPTRRGWADRISRLFADYKALNHGSMGLPAYFAGELM